MENMGDWEQKNLVNELTQGRELAKQLQIHINVPSSSYETREFLVQKILASFEKALSMAHGSNSSAADPNPTNIAGVANIQMSESPPSLNGSPRSDQDSDREQDFKDSSSRKRKSLPRWTQQVRVSPGMGLEGPLDDGFSWRKYGQKDILGAKYPRGYYRCTHRNVQRCFATKQVQRSDQDPTIFEITYRGKHTCNQPSRNVPPPSATTEAQTDQPHDHQQPLQDVVLSNFKAGLKVITEDLDKINNSSLQQSSSSFHFPSSSSNLKDEMSDVFFMSSMMETNFGGSFTPSFISPATSGTNYFSLHSHSHSPMSTEFVGNQDFQTDIAENISVPTPSATNSPTVAASDYPFGQGDQFNPNFTFDNPGPAFF
ncbi:hypothetical protein FNV43_RR23973 [Rhamnella rubrinervis]|uniref:WRKY domain-containing protein n=1 Tax=Rhamnella rubrinervis TaxID=2594499 RepID=A0A8K0DQ97_9ROSA|nr:hypothetical protein FNV43_RR23973 [Rhamnella rubrinervis]